MQIDFLSELRIWPPRGRFVLCRTPMHVITDLLWESGSLNWSNQSDFNTDFDLQIAYPRPLRVPQNSELWTARSTAYTNLLTDATSAGGYDTSLTWLKWQVVSETAGTIEKPIWGSQATRSLGVWLGAPSFAAANSNSFALATESGGGAAFKAHSATVSMLVRPQPPAVLASGAMGGVAAAGNPPDAWVAAIVGSGDDRAWWRVRTTFNGDWLIERKYVGESDYKPIQTLALSMPTRQDEESPTQGGGQSRIDVEFRLMAGRLQIRIGDQSDTSYFSEARINGSGHMISTMTGLEVGASRFLGVSLWAEQGKWHRNASYTSPAINLGFSASTAPSWSILEAPSEPPDTGEEWTANLDPAETSLVGTPEIYYKLDLTGPNDGTYKGTEYSNLAIAIRSVNFVFPKVESFTPTHYSTPQPFEIEVTHQFNPDTLQVESSAVAAFVNQRDVLLPNGQTGTFAQWAMSTGQMASEIWMARTSAATGLMSAPELVFTGYAKVRDDIEGKEGGSVYQMSMADRIRQMRNPRWRIPWMDGWNVFYAIAFLAQMGGISISDMAFRHLVPTVPTGPGSDLGDGDGGGAYYLPYGPAGSAISRPSTSDLWVAMTRIAAFVGYMLFPNVRGELDFRKFKSPVGTKRSFFESDRESALYQAGGGAEGCWSLSLSKDMDEVRSESILIGVNAFTPQWDPIIYKWVDDAVVDDATAYNHLGYSNPTSWLDSIFANEDFAREASQQMFRFFRTPGLDVRLRTWLQPDLFPLDMISVEAPRLGIDRSTRFMLLSVKHRQTKEIGESMLVGRFVPA